MITEKRDQACLWARHCDSDFQTAIAELVPGQQIHVMVNGSRTAWARMNDGKDGRPTLGLKIVDGKAAWQMISLGQSCELRLVHETEAAGTDAVAVPQRSTAKMIPLPVPISGDPLFDCYMFADYSGAADLKGQKKAIKLAYAEAKADHRVADESLTRDRLVVETLKRLRIATAEGKRLCFGFDHQFGIPFGLLEEMGIADLNWREVLDAIVEGHGVPALKHPSTYARMFNDWCSSRGKRPYFYSATKASLYGIPGTDPRTGEVETVIRLTERCESMFGSGKPKPYNRVGDNGTVGGQTIMGLIKLREILATCHTDGIPLKCWPFDGLDIDGSAYAGSHVLIEPYPAAVRSPGVAYTDVNDAIACVQLIQRFDQAGKLVALLNLKSLSEAHAKIVRVEGWIAGHSPLSIYGLKG